MGLHPDFPESPYEILKPAIRWFPADERDRNYLYQRLIPPLVGKVREAVYVWREGGYAGASETSKALLKWWFQTPHPTEARAGEVFDFRYYFAQREAVESVIYLYEVARAREAFDLIRDYDATGVLSKSLFTESWTRYVVKMATGSGKTKVLSLIIAWSYFHKLYEKGSPLSRNVLLIAPNIIVLERLFADFRDLRIFSSDPVLPTNGFAGRDWQSDFQMTLHVQDDIGRMNPGGNLFLTNIHRVYHGTDTVPSAADQDTSDFFLGPKPVGATNESRLDVGDIVRAVEELVILNDEAHHIHDERLGWFKAIDDIHNKLVQKGKVLSLQLDVTATPRHQKGAIFVQTISDYPLVEAISQNVVKHPVMPDEPSRAKLKEHSSAIFTERYEEYIDLAYVEWKKVYEEHKKAGKKAVLFAMTDDTKNCDKLGEYLEQKYPEFLGKVLVIHTNQRGEVSESVSSRGDEELRMLREAANNIDTWDSPYLAVVSVMMLREGWDVRNVTTVLGLKALNAENKILPEQALGRGIRRMYPRQDQLVEYVSAIGSDGFMEFVESITREGVELDYKPMGDGAKPKTPLVVEVDRENSQKDLDALDIEIPVLTPRLYREYMNLSDLDVSTFDNKRIPLKMFSEQEQREIVFRDVATNEVTHITRFDGVTVPDFTSVVGFLTNSLMKEMRLVGGYDILFGKMKKFLERGLFEAPVELNDLNTLRNLSEPGVPGAIINIFRRKINDLTVRDKGEARISNHISLRKTRPFMVTHQEAIEPKRSIFNRVVGDSHFELQVADAFDKMDGVVAFAKNYFAVNFKMEYQNANGDIANYYPDFIVKLEDGRVFVIETKGREDLDDVEKVKRLAQWCVDVNAAQGTEKFHMLYVMQEDWDRLQQEPRTFDELVAIGKTEEYGAEGS